VLQGERPMAAGNKTIGRFHLDGIPPAPRGTPQIDVGFDIDANGILHVSAKDRATGKEQSIRIEASSGLNESDIQKMVRDAEQHAGEDQKRKESVEARNRADAMVYEVEKNLKEHDAKLDATVKTEVGQALDRVKEALKGEDTPAIDSATENLQAIWSKAAASLYQQASSTPPDEPPPAGQGPGKKPGDGAVDADFEVVP